DLKDIVARQLEPYIVDPTHVLLDGDTVALMPRTALALSMVLHELATNAAKYGALSTASGRLEVRWTVEPPGQPGSTAPDVRKLSGGETEGRKARRPGRRGFGSGLIERSPRELDGEMTLAFDPAGVRYSVTLPLRRGRATPA